MAPELSPQPLDVALTGFAGSWVTVDRSTNEARAAAATPHELAAEIRRRGLSNVAVVRARGDDEPELVGLG